MRRFYVMAGTLLPAVLLMACTSRPDQVRQPGVAPADVPLAHVVGPHCVYTDQGAGDTLLIGPTVLPSGEVRRMGTVLENGLIKEVGEAGAVQSRYARANRVECQRVLITPGLVNAHEHLPYSFARPPASLAPVYVHRDEWRNGENAKDKLVATQTEDPALLASIELRHLLHGATTVAGSGGMPGFVKNVSSPASDANVFVADMKTFPFGTDVNVRFGAAPCDLDAGKLGAVQLSTGAPLTAPLVAHVGEGTNCAAKLEIDQFLAQAQRGPARGYGLIHAIKLDRSHLPMLKAGKVSVIWSPRSNLALYGQTLDPAWLLDAGVNVGLGTDWSPSGSFDMIEEMRCARTASAATSRELSGAEILKMATIGAATSLGLENQIGSIATGKAADLAIFADPGSAGASVAGTLDNAAMLAVFIDGQLRAGDTARFQGRLPPRCRNAVAGKFVCEDFSGLAFTFDQVLAASHEGVAPMATDGQAACNPGRRRD